MLKTVISQEYLKSTFFVPFENSSFIKKSDIG